MHLLSQTSPPNFCAKQKGFTLIEVMVSILLFTLGILGAAGLILSTIQSNREARLQSTGVTLVNELTDALRDNKNVALNTTAGTNPYLVDINKLDASATLPSAAVDCVTSECQLPDDFAKWQMRRWLERVRQELPESRVVVCFDSTPYNSSGLGVWNCDNTGTSLAVKLAWQSRAIGSGTKGGIGSNETAQSKANPGLVLTVTPGSSQ